MSHDFTKHSDKVYGISGVPLILLCRLCSYINFKSRGKYMKSRWGWVVRSYDYLAFRCNCSRWAITQAVKELRDLGLIKTIKKGPHDSYNFGVNLDRLIEFTREWTDEKKELANRKTDAMDRAEEELMMAMDASDDEDTDVDFGMFDPDTEQKEVSQ